MEIVLEKFLITNNISREKDEVGKNITKSNLYIYFTKKLTNPNTANTHIP